MRKAGRWPWWLACGARSAAMIVAVLAGVTAARAQAATDSITQEQAESTYGGLWSAGACSRPSSPRLASAALEAGCGEHVPVNRDGEQRRPFGVAQDEQAAALHSRLAAADATGDASPSAADANSLPDAPQPQGGTPVSGGYEPITAAGRLEWIVYKTLGPPDLIAGVIWSGYGTAVNKPREDGTHWGGFAERYGVRLTGIATSNVIEAGFGALWGEDPRYVPHPEKSFGARVANIFVQTVMTRRRDGSFAPAYARFIAVPGNNFLSNTWRPDSEADAYHAGLRTLEGLGGVVGANTWDEFWPTVRDHLFHKH